MNSVNFQALCTNSTSYNSRLPHSSALSGQLCPATHLYFLPILPISGTHPIIVRVTLDQRHRHFTVTPASSDRKSVRGYEKPTHDFLSSTRPIAYTECLSTVSHLRIAATTPKRPIAVPPNERDDGQSCCATHGTAWNAESQNLLACRQYNGRSQGISTGSTGVVRRANM